jgi:hypothetical protein
LSPWDINSCVQAVLEGLDSKDFSTAAIATAQLAMIPHGLKVVNLTIQDLQNHPKSPIPIIDEITTKGTQEIAAEARIGAAKVMFARFGTLTLTDSFT